MAFRSFAIALAIVLAPVAASAAQVNVAQYVKPDSFDQIKISPDGKYYAATVPSEDNSILVVLNRADNKVMGGFGLGKNTYIADFEWVNDKRVVFGTARKFGGLDEPRLTGNLYAMNADGSGKDILVGQDVNVMSTGTHIQTKKAEMIAAFLIDGLPDDDKNVLILARPFSGDTFNRAEKMDVYNGKRVPVARSPVRNADYLADGKGVVRFAWGSDLQNVNKLYYRAADASDWTKTADWKELNNEAASDHIEIPLGFSPDNRYAYLQVEQPSGPDSIVAFDTTDGSRKTVLRDPVGDPGRIIGALGKAHASPVGAFIAGGKPHTAFFDDAGDAARLYRSLEAAFPGNTVAITSTTSDGALALVQVSSDRDPGSFYLFDTVNKKADFVLARRDWVDPAGMSEMRPVELKARDGLALHGFLTIPHGSNGNGLPMVVLPHGGPFFERDNWGFGIEPQMLAAAGYAVLQVNFRGSSGYGRAFTQAGAREWGGKMQDDITDATRWAIGQGIADRQRICIYGASYGAYAALEGVAKEPTLYKCAAGYVGVYDLPLMFSKGDTRELESGRNYMHDWIGEPSRLDAISPVNEAARIKVPVFLAAGGEDERAPIEHSERMEKALRDAGVPVETLYIRTEGHGFYTTEHQVQFYDKLLDFLGRNIGGGATAATAPAATTH
ncbi:S9 family peptidase [Pseudoluteimonas lycopersici]|uniref:S9 family peptidase n=1 Tax=Pseudoluteimonas lycopersici TaxID=1324796 RepID=A0A516V4I2_9GAMM|nr:S9 family peptidase [Lysobacter lycopersici]QDQ73438.1 S9 family peptidase [Lysobacter lycopersici]